MSSIVPAPKRPPHEQNAAVVIACLGLALMLVLAASIAWGFDTVGPTQSGTIENESASATAANASIVLAAQTNKRGRIYAVSANCNVGAATMTIFNGATVIWTDLVGTSGIRLSWGVPLTGTAGTAMTAVLTSCGTGNVGSLSVQGDVY